MLWRREVWLLAYTSKRVVGVTGMSAVLNSRSTAVIAFAIALVAMSVSPSTAADGDGGAGAAGFGGAAGAGAAGTTGANGSPGGIVSTLLAAAEGAIRPETARLERTFLPD